MAAVAAEAASIRSLLDAELRAFPGRWNLTLRTVLGCAICLVTSMTLGVPFVGAISLFVVFYATQSNVVMTRLVGVVMLVGMALAFLVVIALLKFTFEDPPLRIAASGGLIFAGLYLMRITGQLGVVFYLVTLVIAVMQGYFDLAPPAEIMLRAVLWAVVAALYPLLVSLVINSLLLPLEPLRQLKDEARRQLAAIDATLRAALDGQAATPIDAESIQDGILAGHELLRFAWMRDRIFAADRARHLAVAATVANLLGEARRLALRGRVQAPHASLVALREACARLAQAIEHETPLTLEGIAPPARIDGSPVGLMWQMLEALAEQRATPIVPPPARQPLIAADAFTNPAYGRFALKTLLAMTLAYLFLSATDWIGIKTAVTTCLIVAQPSLGESNRKIRLRAGGALVGAALALVMTIVLVPRIESIVGLLLMALPVYALAAWIAAGSERISYAGLQLAYTFGLAMFMEFGPSTDLADIRDRVLGIAIGIAISYVVQTRLWPETESTPLAVRVHELIEKLAGAIHAPAGAETPTRLERLWQDFDVVQEMLARIALEPDLRQGDDARAAQIHAAQTRLGAVREILIALGPWRALRDAQWDDLRADQRRAVDAAEARLAKALGDLAADARGALAIGRVPRGADDTGDAALPDSLRAPLVRLARAIARLAPQPASNAWPVVAHGGVA